EHAAPLRDGRRGRGASRLRDQRHAAGRRDARAAHHLHGDGADDDGRHQPRPAEDRRRPAQPACPAAGAEPHQGWRRLPRQGGGGEGGAGAPPRRHPCRDTGPRAASPRRSGPRLWRGAAGHGPRPARRHHQGGAGFAAGWRPAFRPGAL
ncbi:MAG: Tol biopolymer transport system, TolR protein, partial [uncultured Craurococcus sp.]